MWSDDLCFKVGGRNSGTSETAWWGGHIKDNCETEGVRDCRAEFIHGVPQGWARSAETTSWQIRTRQRVLSTTVRAVVLLAVDVWTRINDIADLLVKYIGLGLHSCFSVRCRTLKPYFHYGCALRCVARVIETPIVFLFLSPRNATRSRNGNRLNGTEVACSALEAFLV